MAKNQDSLVRQWHMLRQIPRYPQKIAVRGIQERLKSLGFDVTARTLQRDLIELSEVFPLTVDDREKPFGWSWERSAKSFDLPAIGVAESLTLSLAEQHLSQLMPASLLEHLAPYFKAAHERLNHASTPQQNRAWINKVRTVPPTQPLLPPNIPPEIHHTLTDALLRERKLKIQYRKKGSIQTSAYVVTPLALVQRGVILYLRAVFQSHTDPRTLAIHRIAEAVMLDEPGDCIDDFDIDQDLTTGVWGFGSGGSIELKLRFSGGSGQHLLESPLSHDQQVQQDPLCPDALTITATVANTPQLQWWIQGFGDGVEVLAPKELRQRLSQVAAKMLNVYAASTK